MKTLIKHIEIGKYKFYVGIDRDIVADTFEEFPDLVEFLLSNTDGNENDIIIKSVREKKLRQVLDTNNQIADFVKFAFPRMLKKADKEKKTSNAAKADEIIDYIYENEADTVFNAEMFKFICSGFTPETAERKPKVKFVMK